MIIFPKQTNILYSIIYIPVWQHSHTAVWARSGTLVSGHCFKKSSVNFTEQNHLSLYRHSCLGSLRHCCLGTLEHSCLGTVLATVLHSWGNRENVTFYLWKYFIIIPVGERSGTPVGVRCCIPRLRGFKFLLPQQCNVYLYLSGNALALLSWNIS